MGSCWVVSLLHSVSEMCRKMPLVCLMYGKLTILWLVFILYDRLMSAMAVTNLHTHRKTIAPILGISSNNEAFHQICYWTCV
jgi:hypothetical protein